MGLIKYVMSLMNAARLGIGAQSVGLCEAAYREALKYAHERKQFGRDIIKFPAVSEMLTQMRAKLHGTRALLYETSRFVEVYKQYAHISRERSLEGEERQEMKYYNRLADVYTPLVKLLSSEFANELAYDSVQIHGGSGYMKDFACERLYRDARVLNIYEGTSQLQVVAAINGVTKGVFMDSIARYEAMEYAESMQAVKERLISLRERVDAMVAHVESVSKESAQFRDFHARRLVESVGYIIITHLLAKQAAYSEEYGSDAKVFLKMAEQYIAGAEAVILSSSAEDVALWSEVQEEL
jgi:hypothetical protein